MRKININENIFLRQEHKFVIFVEIGMVKCFDGNNTFLEFFFGENFLIFFTT